MPKKVTIKKQVDYTPALSKAGDLAIALAKAGAINPVIWWFEAAMLLEVLYKAGLIDAEIANTMFYWLTGFTVAQVCIGGAKDLIPAIGGIL